MIIEAFLGAILPTVGRYCIVGIDKSGAKSFQSQIVHRRSDTLSQAVADVHELLADNYNLYYCTGGLGLEDNRQSSNIVSKRELYIDIDCGADKPYQDIKAGSVALKKFLNESGLPKPVIVLSGNGIHAHWIFPESISCDEWLPVATALKTKCKQLDFHVDPTVMADTARILRIPGTINHRGGNEVLLANAITYYNFDDLRTVIGEDQTAMLRGIKKSLGLISLDKSTQALLSNRQSKYETIVIKSMEGTGCAQIKYAVENSDKLSEPLWRAHLSNAHVCSDREYGVDIVSRDYPDYDAEAALNKAADTKGPQSCEIFQSLEQAGLCAGCQHAGKITAPVQLGYEIAKAIENQTVSVTSVSGVAKDYVLPKLPFPYFFGQSGGVYKTSEVVDKTTGTISKIDDVVYPHNLYVYQRMHDPDLGDMLWCRLHLPKDGVREFLVPQSSLMAIDKFRDIVSAKGITSSTMGQLQKLQYFIIRMVEELQHQDRAQSMHARFGWSGDGESFYVGDRVYSDSGVHHAPPANGLIQLAGHMDTKGTLADWVSMANVYNTVGLEAQAFALFCAFGSPLMQFSQEGGCLVNLFSSDSGTGKTTSVMMGNSVFGHPKKMLLMKQDTAMSKINRLGTMNSIMVGIDEITNMEDKDTSELMYSITSQRGRNRMSAKENVERTNQIEWNNLVVSTSNSSLVDKLRGLKEDPQGELARLIEIRVRPAGGIDKHAADQIFSKMFTNYGIAGDVYMRYIMANKAAVYSVIKEAQDYIIPLFKFTGPERFHSNTIVYSFAGALLAKKLLLHDIDIGRVVRYMIGVYKGVRETIAQSKGDPEGTLANFLAEHRNNILIINGAGAKGIPTAPMLEPKGSMMVRYEPDTDTMWIMQSPFIKWAARHQVNTREMMEDIKFRHGIVMSVTKKRMDKGTNLDIGGASRVYQIPQAKEKLGIAIEVADVNTGTGQ